MTLQSRTKKELKKHIFVYGMLSVAIINFFVFWLYPNINSFLLPFQDDYGNFSLHYINLVWDNIRQGAQSEIIGSLKNTLIYYITGLVTQLPISVFFAYCLYKKIAFHRFFNIIFLIPMIVSSVVLVSVYKNILSIDGPISLVYKVIFNKPAPNFLYDERYATACIVLYSIFTGFGLNLIMYSGALNRIPPHLWEQAKLDGVGFMRSFFSIAFPLVWPTFSILLLLSTIGIFSADAPILLFTAGMYGTKTLGYWMYENVVLERLYNYASALGLFMTLASLPIFFIVIQIRKKLPDDIQY